MNLHDGFLVDAAAIAGSEFSASMRQRRSDLVRYAKTIREELVAFQGGLAPDGVLEAVRRGVEPGADGGVGVPDLAALLATSEMGFASWPELVNDVDARMAALKEVLLSADMRAAASSEFEDPLLTRPAFAGLGDVVSQ